MRNRLRGNYFSVKYFEVIFLAVVLGICVQNTNIVFSQEKKPITIEYEKSTLYKGYGNTTINDIVIRENFAGALNADETISLVVDEMQFEFGTSFEVLEGDIEIQEVKRNEKGEINLAVKTPSTTPSTIKLKGMRMYYHRSIKDGNCPLRVKTKVSADNFASEKEIAYIDDFIEIKEKKELAFTSTIIVKIGEYKMTVIENE